MSVVSGATSVRSEVGAVPAAIQAMPIQKLQIALAKSIANLKTRDRAIETLKNQLAAMRASDTNESVHIPGAQARQAEQLRHRAEKAEDEVAELVKVSKASAAAHETQIQDLSMELTKLRRSVVEHDDSKAHKRLYVQDMTKQQLASLRSAVSEAIRDKEATFEALGAAREKTLELQDALADANAQVRLLTAEVAALRSELDAGLANGENSVRAAGENEPAVKEREDASLAKLRDDLHAALVESAAAQQAALEADVLVAKLQNDVSRSDAEAAAALQARGDADAACEELRNALDDASAEAAAARELRDEADAACAELRKALDEASVEAVAALQARGEADTLLVGLQKALTDSNAKKAAAEQARDTAHERLGQLQEDLDSARAERAAAQLASDEARERLGKVQEDLDAARAKLADARCAREVGDTASVELRAEPRSSCPELAEALEELARLKAQAAGGQSADVEKGEEVEGDTAAVTEELMKVRGELAQCAAEAAAREGELQGKLAELTEAFSRARAEFFGREALLLREVERLRGGLAEAATIAEERCDRGEDSIAGKSPVAQGPHGPAARHEIGVCLKRLAEIVEDGTAVTEQQAVAITEMAARAAEVLSTERGDPWSPKTGGLSVATGGPMAATAPPVATGCESPENEVTQPMAEVERLQAAEAQTVDELTRRLEELAVEKRRNAEPQRVLVGPEASTKARQDHLKAEASALQEQLLSTEGSKEKHLLQAQVRERVRGDMALLFEQQHEQLSALAEQVAQRDTRSAASSLEALEAGFVNLRQTLTWFSADVMSHLHPASEPADAAARLRGPADCDRGPMPFSGDTPATDAAAGIVQTMLEEAEVAGGAPTDQPQATEKESSAVVQAEHFGSRDGEHVEGYMGVTGRIEEEGWRSSEEFAAAVAARDAAVVERDALAAQLTEASVAAAAVTAESEAGRAAAEAERDALAAQLAEASAVKAQLTKERDATITCFAEASAAAAIAAADFEERIRATEEALSAMTSERDALAVRLAEASATVPEPAVSGTDLGGAAEGSELSVGQNMDGMAAEPFESCVAAKEELECSGSTADQSGLVKHLQDELKVAQAEAQRVLQSMAGSESEVKRKAAAALKKARFLHDARTAELTRELEEERDLRRAEAAASAAAVAAAESRVTDAAAIAAARGAAAEAAEAAAAAAVERQAAAEAAATAAAERQAAAEAEVEAAKSTVAAATAATAVAAAEAAEREERLKKGLLDLKSKLKASAADVAAAEAAVAAAEACRDEAIEAASAAKMRVAVLEQEGERREAEARDYRNRAQALLASKTAEIEAARAIDGAQSTEAAHALALVDELRAELAVRAADAAAAAAAHETAEAAAAAAAEEAAAEAADLRQRVAAAEAAEAAAKGRIAALERAQATAPRPVAPAAAAVAEMEAALAAAAQELAALQQIAEQREAALEAALVQLAEVRAVQLTAPPPVTPPQLSPLAAVSSMQPPHWPTGRHLRAINTAAPPKSATSSGTPSPLPRDSSFDMDAMMGSGVHAHAVASRSRSTNLQAADVVEAATEPLRRRILGLEAEVVELTADVERYEAQAQVLKEELREVERSKSREATRSNAQVMEFLKANIISLYCTGEAERLLEPLSRLLSFSDSEVAQCQKGLQEIRKEGVPLAGAAAAVDSAAEYLGSWFGLR